MALHDPAAFRQFYDRTFDPTYRFAYALCGAEAEAEESVAAIYADAWLTWRRLPRRDDEMQELLDDLFARGYEDFQRRHRLIGEADEIARLTAATIQRRWEQTSSDFRRDHSEPASPRLKLLGPDPDTTDADAAPTIGDAEASAEDGAPAGQSGGGAGEMSNWRRVRW